jgi:hypothetical protein
MSGRKDPREWKVFVLLPQWDRRTTRHGMRRGPHWNRRKGSEAYAPSVPMCAPFVSFPNATSTAITTATTPMTVAIAIP